MPTYEYECKKCEHRFDAFQSMSDEPLKTCPECGGKVRRLIGAGAGIIFKGSGFYVTDSRKSSSGSTSSKSESKKSENSTSKSGDSSGSSTGGSDSKSNGNGSGSSKSDGKKSGSDSSKSGKK